MAGQNTLLKLVHSLEKRDVIILRKKLNESPLLIALLDACLKISPDSPNIPIELNNKLNKQNLASLRLRLYQNIIDILSVNNIKNQTIFKLTRYMNRYHFLIGKKLHKEALKEAIKGFQLALDEGKPILALEFQYMVLVLEGVIQKKDIPKDINSYDMLEKLNRSTIVETYFNKNKYYNNIQNKQNVFVDIETPFGSISEDTIHKVLPIQQFRYFVRLGNHKVIMEENPIQYYTKAIDSINLLDENNSTRVIFNYGLTCSTILHAICWSEKEIAKHHIETLKNKMLNLPKKLFAIIENQKKITPFETLKLFYSNKFNTSDLAEKKLLIQLIQKEYSDITFYRSANDLYQFPLGYAHFLLGDYSKALGYLYEIISTPKSDKYYNERHYYQARILELMIGFNQKNISHTIKMAQAVKSHLGNNKKKIHPLEKQLFHLFNNSIFYISMTERKKQISKILSIIEEKETEGFLNRRIPYVNLKHWLQGIK